MSNTKKRSERRQAIIDSLELKTLEDYTNQIEYFHNLETKTTMDEKVRHAVVHTLYRMLG
jgi:hypothetical protein